MRLWCWERLKAGGERNDRGWDGWIASPAQWAWVWASSRSWWRTGKPDMLQSMGLKRVGYNWATKQQQQSILKIHLLTGLLPSLKNLSYSLGPFLFILFLHLKRFYFQAGFWLTTHVCCILCAQLPSPQIISMQSSSQNSLGGFDVNWKLTILCLFQTT